MVKANFIAAREIMIEFVFSLCENGLVPGSATTPHRTDSIIRLTRGRPGERFVRAGLASLRPDWGAHAPSRADFGASPKCFLFNQRKSSARRQRQHARARALPRAEIGISVAIRQSGLGTRQRASLQLTAPGPTQRAERCDAGLAELAPPIPKATFV